MCQGEHAELRCTSQYGFGAHGSFSFPSVPQDADLEYDIELLSFTEPEDREVGGMLFEERLEAAKRARLKVPVQPNI